MMMKSLKTFAWRAVALLTMPVMLHPALAQKPNSPMRSAQSGSIPHQTIETPRGLGIPIDAIPGKVREPISGTLTKAGFEARLRAGGIVSLAGPDLIIGQPDYQQDHVVFMALDTLELKKGARIVTNGNTLILFVNHLISEDGGIVTFTQDNSNAAAGGLGSAGKPGVPGRLTSVHVIKDLTGILHTDLTGQNGGRGGNGNSGLAGQPGTKGDQSVSGVFDCAKGGGNGTAGAPGGVGGQGGDGGAGGAGGILELYNVGTAPIPVASYTFVSNGGKGGIPGTGGPGGAGGAGGDGGDGSRNCGGGHPGPDGAPGAKGPDGGIGPVPNDGNAIVKNIDLEFILTKEIPNLGKASAN
jgi:hypothetical protein